MGNKDFESWLQKGQIIETEDSDGDIVYVKSDTIEIEKLTNAKDLGGARSMEVDP